MWLLSLIWGGIKAVWAFIVWVTPMALVAAIIAAASLWLDSEQDARERASNFHEITQQAEQLYCDKKDSGIPAKLKVLIDQAVSLEPGISKQLSPLNYITLAAVGSIVLPYEQAHGYGERGLEAAKQSSNNTIDKYAANLVLGHIDFQRLHESQDRHYLNEARKHFMEARRLVNADDSHRNLHFQGQLFLIWGWNEHYVGETQKGEIAISRAKDAWSQLPHKKSRLRGIDLVVSDIKRGIPPRLPCPSIITVSPQYYVQSQSAKSNGNPSDTDDEIDERPTTDAGNDIGFSDFEQRFSALESGFRSEIKSVGDEITREIRELRARLPLDAEPPPAPAPSPSPSLDSETDEKPSLPPDHPGHPGPEPAENANPKQPKSRHCDPVTQQNCCTFFVVNKTYHDIRLRINGYEGDEVFIVKAKGQRQYWLPCGELNLKRFDNGAETTWNENELFRYWDGSKVTRTIQLTDCCMSIVN